MKPYAIKVTIAILLLCSLYAWGEINWTSQISPVAVGVFNRVCVADLNKDGIPDLIAANGNPDAEASAYSGLPIWFGEVYYSGGKWVWSITQPGATTGDSASKPYNIFGTYRGELTYPRSGYNYEIEEWTVTCVSPTQITDIGYFYADGAPHDITGVMQDYGAFEKNCTSQDEIIKLTKSSSNTWIVESNVGGRMDDYTGAGAYYDAANGKFYFKLSSAANSYNQGDYIVFRIQLARFTCTGSKSGTLVNATTGMGPRMWEAFYGKKGEWTNILSFIPVYKNAAVQVGDSYKFHTPEGPQTTDIYYDVKVADLNKDGSLDIIGAGKYGLRVWCRVEGDYTTPTFYASNKAFIPGDCFRGEYPVMTMGITGYPDIHWTTSKHEPVFVELVKAGDADWYWSPSGQESGTHIRSVNCYDPVGGGIKSVEYISNRGEFTFRVDPYSSQDNQLAEDNFLGMDEQKREPQFQYYCKGSKFIFSTKHYNFSPELKIASGWHNRIDVGDINKDGWIDIVSAKDSGGLSILKNRGPQGDVIQVQSQTPPSSASSGKYLNIMLKDLNFDGRLDLVACGQNKGVQVFLGNGVFGWYGDMGPTDSGTFTGLAIDDFNLDGVLDIAVTKTTGGIYIWYGQLSEEKDDIQWYQIASASVPQAYSGNQGHGSMSTVEVNNQNTKVEDWEVTCIQGGTSSTYAIFEAVGTVSGKQGNLVKVNEYYHSDGNEVGFIIARGEQDDPFQPGDHFNFTTAKGPLSAEIFQDIMVSDINNDGKPDLFAASQNIGIRVWTGNGVFGWVEETSPVAEGNYLGVSANIDLNRDGNPDVVGAKNGGGIQVWVGDGNDRYPFTSWISKPVGTGDYFGVTASDQNHDGDKDVIGAQFKSNAPGIQIWTGNGSGDWQNYYSASSYQEYYSVVAADINNDGWEDIIAGHKNSGVHVFKNNTDGSYTNWQNPINEGSFRTVIARDFNRDGLIDIAASEEVLGVHLWLNEGSGTWGDNIGPSSIEAIPSWGLDAVDINLDGALDLIVGGHTGTGLHIWWGQVTGDAQHLNYNVSQAPGRYINYIFGSEGYNNIYGVKAADFNLDGKPDIACGENGHFIYTMYMTGTSYAHQDGGCEMPGQYIASGQSRGVDIADFNNDGVPDMVVADNGGGVKVFKGTLTAEGLTNWGGLISPVGTGDYHSVFTTDFTHDGLPDIAAAHGVSGAEGIDVWLSSRDFTPPVVSSIFPSNNGTFKIDVDKSIQATFSEPMDEATLNANTLSVIQGETRTINGAYFLSQDRIRIYFIPETRMEKNIQVRVTITGGDSGVLDQAGNGLDGNGDGRVGGSPEDDYSWTFTPIDVTAPRYPANFKADPGDRKAILSWKANSEPDLAGYKLYGTGIQNPQSESDFNWWVELDRNTTSYTKTGLENYKEYTFFVKAFDDVGNISTSSSWEKVTPQPVKPVIWAGGYMGKQISAAQGGVFGPWLYVSDPQGAETISRVEILMNLSPTGATLQVIDPLYGDPNGALYGFPDLPIPPDSGIPAGTYLLEYVATDTEGNQSFVFPYLNVIASETYSTGAPIEREMLAKELLLLHEQAQMSLETLMRKATAPTKKGSKDSQSPQIWWAGWFDTYIDAESGGDLSIVAYVSDPQGYNNIYKVSLYAGGVDLGLYMHDDGSHADGDAYDGAFGLTLNLSGPIGAGLYLIDIVAMDKNYNEGTWPALIIEP